MSTNVTETQILQKLRRLCQITTNTVMVQKWKAQNRKKRLSPTIITRSWWCNFRHTYLVGKRFFYESPEISFNFCLYIFKFFCTITKFWNKTTLFWINHFPQDNFRYQPWSSPWWDQMFPNSIQYTFLVHCLSELLWSHLAAELWQWLLILNHPRRLSMLHHPHWWLWYP